VRFLIDSMLPPQVASLLRATGHDAFSPADLGAHALPDDALIEIASAEHLVIVTENASDFAAVTTCPVVFVRKSWWPAEALVSRLALALDRWAAAHPDLGPWAHWLEAGLR
jgi:uncharacterized protein with PIN domain